MDIIAAGMFTIAALALLGSPGPGIAALVALGRQSGFWGSMRFFWGLQLGLATAAGISAAGLFSAFAALPFAALAMSLSGALYLLYLAWRMATAPVGVAEERQTGASLWHGVLLGLANPKAYLAFLSLMASDAIIAADGEADVTLKWGILVAVMIAVDLAWLRLGVLMGRRRFAPSVERLLNRTMGAVLSACALMMLF